MKKCLLLCWFVVFALNVRAAQETIPSGSFIINLGVVPQTINNGLKPYGLVYAMLQNFHVPVKWAINPAKGKDGTDFTYNGTSYRGGSFIILAQYRTSEVNTAIQQWVTMGVVGETIASEIIVDIYGTLSYAPRWTLDKEFNTNPAGISGELVVPFFSNAGIPPSAYGGSSVAGWKNPSELTECDDIFVLPHADPIYATHNNLLEWNLKYKGAIWSGCHAVSVMEGLMAPGGSNQMNFLSKTGLVHYQSHQPVQPPYVYDYPTDPVAQFMGKLDLAANGGSEIIYFPKAGGGWRPETRIIVSQPGVQSTPTPSSGLAAVTAYGRGFGDEDRGYVMYQSGHFHSGSSPDHIALQRSFFNFAFLAVLDRQANSITAQINAAAKMSGGSAYPVKFTIPAGRDISDYQIRWSASSGQILPNATARDITFIPPADPAIKIVLLTLFLTDKCGRQFFTTFDVEVSHCSSVPLAPVINFPATIAAGQTYPLDFSTAPGSDLSQYTIQWTASSGKIVGDASAQNVQYEPPVSPVFANVKLTVVLTSVCETITIEKDIKVIFQIPNNGLVTASKLLSTNNDGSGYDYFYLENIELYPKNEVTIYNRWGNVVYKAKGYDNLNVKFDGLNMASAAVTDGVFYYVIHISSANVPKESAYLKGFFILKR